MQRIKLPLLVLIFWLRAQHIQLTMWVHRWLHGSNGVENPWAQWMFLRTVSLILIAAILNMSIYPGLAVAQAARGDVNHLSAYTNVLVAAGGQAFHYQTTSTDFDRHISTQKEALAILENAIKEVAPQPFYRNTAEVSVLNKHHVAPVSKKSAEGFRNVLSKQLPIINQKTEGVLADFANELNQLKENRADPIIIDRQIQSLSEIKNRFANFGKLSLNVINAKPDQLTQAIDNLAVFIKDHPNVSQHHFTDPSQLPFRKYTPPRIEPAVFSNEFIKRKIHSDVVSEKEIIRYGKSLKLEPDNGYLEANEEIVLSTVIKHKAAELQNDPVRIFEWVRDNIEYLPTYGSIQNSDMVLVTQRGNDFDTATLLIALLRASGIHARYVYGTIEVPAERVMNLVGNVSTPEDAQTLLAQGGVPNTALISGGVIKSLRVERIWVEAWVNYMPARGAKHTLGTGNSWVPLDASFKSFNYARPIEPLSNEDIGELVTAYSKSTEENVAEGWIRASDLNAFKMLYEDKTHTAFRNTFQGKPALNTGQLLGTRTINAQRFRMLPATLPYKTVAVAAKYQTIPDSLRWKLGVSYFSSARDKVLDFPSIYIELSLSKLATKRLGVTYLPSTNADRQKLKELKEQNAKQIPVHQIQIKPHIRLDDLNLAEGPSISMGQSVHWSLQFYAPGSAKAESQYQTTAGDEMVFGVNAIGYTNAQYKLRTILHQEVSAANNLQQVSLAYWLQHDVFDDLLAAQLKMTTYRLPSVGLFSARLNVRYLFGLPISGYYLRRSMDIQQGIRSLVGGSLEDQAVFFIQSGIHGSYLEGLAFDQLFDHEQGTGLSATNIIAELQSEGAKIYQIDQNNLAVALSNVQATQDVKNDIKNAVLSGKHALIPERELTTGGWSGTGYYIIDPETGAGAYLLDGGLNGGDEGPSCDIEPSTEPASESVSQFEINQDMVIIIAVLILIIIICTLNKFACAAIIIGGKLVLGTYANANTPTKQNQLRRPVEEVWKKETNGRQWPREIPQHSVPAPGSCAQELHKELQDKVDDLCNNYPRSCKWKKGDCNIELNQEKVQNNRACLHARLEVMDVCFTGGDPGHWAQLKQVLEGIAKCEDCIASATKEEECKK